MGYVLVRLKGGPRSGYFKYSTPLPNRIVMASLVEAKGAVGLSYSEYERLSDTTDYEWRQDEATT